MGIVGFGRWNRPPKIPSQIFPKLSLSGYRTFGIPFGKGRRCGAVMTVHLQQCTPPEFFPTCCKEYLLKAIVIYAEQVHMTRHFAKGLGFASKAMVIAEDCPVKGVGKFCP